MIEDGYKTCEICKGLGYWIGEINNERHSQPCPKCRGAGKLNWVEEVFGKQPTYDFEFQYYYDGKDWVPK